MSMFFSMHLSFSFERMKVNIFKICSVQYFGFHQVLLYLLGFTVKH